MRGCDDGMRERLEADADGRVDGVAPTLFDGRAGRVVAPPGAWAGSVVAPPGGRAMGCSGSRGLPAGRDRPAAAPPPRPGGSTRSSRDSRTSRCCNRSWSSSRSNRRCSRRGAPGGDGCQQADQQGGAGRKDCATHVSSLPVAIVPLHQPEQGAAGSVTTPRRPSSRSGRGAAMTRPRAQPPSRCSPPRPRRARSRSTPGAARSGPEESPRGWPARILRLQGETRGIATNSPGTTS